MKLIIGLGNPGLMYTQNRHNVGYMLIDALQEHPLPKNIVAQKTGVFMNSSGPAVSSLYTKYNIQNTDLYVVHDDLDIPLGSFKIQFAVGPKDHNGLSSIYQSLGTKDFWHVRIGIENRSPESRTPGETYVLENFIHEEYRLIIDTFRKIIHELKHS